MPYCYFESYCTNNDPQIGIIQFLLNNLMMSLCLVAAGVTSSDPSVDKIQEPENLRPEKCSVTAAKPHHPMHSTLTRSTLVLLHIFNHWKPSCVPQNPAGMQVYPTIGFFAISQFSPGALAVWAAPSPATAASSQVLQPIQGWLDTRVI
jgi:hypothetical protein